MFVCLLVCQILLKLHNESLTVRKIFSLFQWEYRLQFVGMFVNLINYPDVQYDWLAQIHQSIYFPDFQYDQSDVLSRFPDNQSTI